MGTWTVKPTVQTSWYDEDSVIYKVNTFFDLHYFSSTLIINIIEPKTLEPTEKTTIYSVSENESIRYLYQNQ